MATFYRFVGYKRVGPDLWCKEVTFPGINHTELLYRNNKGELLYVRWV